MMELRPGDAIVLRKPQDALSRAIEHLEAHPSAEFLLFIRSGKTGAGSISDSGVQALLTALESEKVVAAEPSPLPSAVLKKFRGELSPTIVTAITSSIAVFKAQVVRDYTSEMRASLGDEATVTDMSLFLNQLGLSSVTTPVDDEFIENLHPIPDHDQPTREWDEYVCHINRFVKQNPANFFTHFAESLTDHGAPRVLVDATGLTATKNGTSRTVTGFLRDFESAIDAGDIDWRVTVLAAPGVLEAHALPLKHVQQVADFELLSSTFDVGITLTPLTSLDRCISLTRSCLRWTVLHLDVIALRSLPHFSQQVFAREALNFTAEFADETIFISEFSQADAESLISPKKFHHPVVARMGVPHEFARAARTAADSGSDVGADGAKRSANVLVLGNDLPHKQTRLAAQSLLEQGFAVTSISQHKPLSDLHRVINPGELDDAQLITLMSLASVIVFPSMYEGYGLPIAEAASLGIPFVVWDTEVSHEVVSQLNITNAVFCGELTSLPAAVNQAMKLPQRSRSSVPTTADFNAQIITELRGMLGQPLDVQFAQSRWNVASLLSAAAEERELAVRADLHSQYLEALNQRKLSRRVRAKLRSLLGR